MEKYFKDSIGGQTEQRQGNHRQYFYTKGPDQRRESDDFGCVTISYLLDLPIRLYNILENSPPPLPTTTTTTTTTTSTTNSTSLQLISSQFFIRAPCFVRLTPPSITPENHVIPQKSSDFFPSPPPQTINDDCSLVHISFSHFLSFCSFLYLVYNIRSIAEHQCFRIAQLFLSNRCCSHSTPI